MRIAVIGLWHLGSVYSACIAKKEFQVIGYDPSTETVDHLKLGQAPIFEPELNKLIQEQIQAGKLNYTACLEEAVKDADVIWICFDTPVNEENDTADVDYVVKQIQAVIPLMNKSATLLISSQLPVGSCQQLLTQHPTLNIAYAPENLRLGGAIKAFNSQTDIAVGCSNEQTQAHLTELMSKLFDNPMWMSLASAEMAKHAINSFLAASIVLTNEIAALCEQVGADPFAIESVLRAEPRISPKAYVKPGPAIAGGTLLRDVTFLNQLTESNKLQLPMLNALPASNANHRLWAVHRLEQKIAGNWKDKVIALWGIAYKPNTSSTRRSQGIDLCKQFAKQGALVNCFDPKAKLDEAIPGVTQLTTLEDTLKNADVIVVSTDCNEFIEALNIDTLSKMRTPLIIDQNSLCQHMIPALKIKLPELDYIATGVTL